MLLKSLPAFLLGKLKRANRRLLAAMSCYLLLALVAVLMLNGFLRAAVLFFFAILAVKTIAHANDERPE